MKGLKNLKQLYLGSEAIRKISTEKKPAYFFCGYVHNAFAF